MESLLPQNRRHESYMQQNKKRGEKMANWTEQNLIQHLSLKSDENTV